MKKLLTIFVAATGFTKLLFRLAVILMSILIVWCIAWVWYDSEEVRLRSKVESQAEIVNLYIEEKKDVLEQKIKLIDLKSAHGNIRKTWPGKWLIWYRPDVIE